VPMQTVSLYILFIGCGESPSKSIVQGDTRIVLYFLGGRNRAPPSCCSEAPEHRSQNAPPLSRARRRPFSMACECVRRHRGGPSIHKSHGRHTNGCDGVTRDAICNYIIIIRWREARAVRVIATVTKAVSTGIENPGAIMMDENIGIECARASLPRVRT